MTEWGLGARPALMAGLSRSVFPPSVARPPQWPATEDGQATAEDGRSGSYNVTGQSSHKASASAIKAMAGQDGLAGQKCQ
jgi:hypothetical protein